MSKIRPVSFDPSGAFLPTGISQQQVSDLLPRLDEIRQEILTTDLELFASGEIPEEKQPLDAGFLELPVQLLAAYQANREHSELGRILKAAARIREAVDRVVVLGIGGSYLGARALMDACCQPYFNEYSRAERGGRPRVYFEGNNVDNDWSAGLLNLLHSQQDERPWAIVVVSKSGATLETAVNFRCFLSQLRSEVGDEALKQLVLPVTGQTGRLAELADAIGCVERFSVPDGVGGRFSVFSAVGLLPAAILGIDIVQLLEAAATMNDHFRNKAPADNMILQYVAVNHLLETKRGCQTRVLSIWNKSLETTGFWYDQLFAESIGKRELGALPITVVNSRDLHSRAQQHQEGRRDKVVNNIIVEGWRYDHLPVGTSDWNHDQLNEIAERSVPEIMDAAIRGTNQAFQEDGRPTTDIRLPAADEAGVGQFMQMMMIATVVEGRLLGVNPYGQPGVENYKRNTNRLLRQPVSSAT